MATTHSRTRRSAKLATPAALSDHISNIDFERHQRMLNYLQEAQLIQQQIASMQTRAAELQSAAKIWFEELHERYGLDAIKGEGVHEDGRLVRVSD